MATGKCLCGAVSYEATGDAIFSANCYCNDCRRVSGSHVAVMAYPEPTLKIAGAPREFESTGDSGMRIARGFCATCGSQLYSKSEAMPGIVLLKAGSLDDPEHYKPTMSIYASRAPSWDRPASELPQLPEMPPRG